MTKACKKKNTETSKITKLKMKTENIKIKVTEKSIYTQILQNIFEGSKYSPPQTVTEIHPI